MSVFLVREKYEETRENKKHIIWVDATKSAKDQEKSPLPQKRHSFEKKVKIDLNLNATDLDKNDCCGSKELEKPPDGGWGWVIVFASLICNVVFGKCQQHLSKIINFSKLERFAKLIRQKNSWTFKVVVPELLHGWIQWAWFQLIENFIHYIFWKI